MSFLRNESGAVTVDWVVLTAALCGTGLAVMGVISDGLEALALDIQAELTGDVITSNFPGDGPERFPGLTDCNGGLEAIQAFATQEADAGRWDVAGQGSNFGAFDPGDVGYYIDDYYATVSVADAPTHIGWWEADYADPNKELHASDYVEWAIVECIAAGVPNV